LLRRPPLTARPERTPVDAGFPELLRLSNAVTPKTSLRGTADTNQYGYRSPFVSLKCEGYERLDAGKRNCFARGYWSLIGRGLGLREIVLPLLFLRKDFILNEMEPEVMQGFHSKGDRLTGGG
jgi:hypothetical protein